MLPWIRVPNAKSALAQGVDPRPRVDEEADLVAPANSGCEVWTGHRIGARGRRERDSPHSSSSSVSRSWAM